MRATMIKIYAYILSQFVAEINGSSVNANRFVAIMVEKFAP